MIRYNATNRRFTAFALAATLSVSALIAPIASQASEEGKRNTALGLGAAAAALLLTQRNKTAGVIAAVGAGIAYKSYDDSIRSRHRREREDWDYRGDRRYNSERDYRGDRRYNDDWNRRERDRREQERIERERRERRERYERDHDRRDRDEDRYRDEDRDRYDHR